MDSRTPARMVVVKKEEKESKLRALILSALAAPSGTRLELRVLAVSPSSPVVLAIAALKSELAASGVTTRIMLVKPAVHPGTLLPGQTDLRHLADARCHDAHELLVLGTETAWIGDSLRRDSAGRDSFEMHAAHDTKTAHFIGRSFERLWQIALSVRSREDEAAANLAASLSAIAAPAETSQALTRH